ncbi:choice-of-anchor E domain-containing protein [Microseira wollei]|uniref:PEP-CTERM protein-sorting domain-containing protein n=1 Tax=Microseira wollei NIES-4236 TaxID=2530354 RepID=A0AAV3XSN0_9CYAN|nr:choice-of-anchor E domain-containing protein [Microseira wollei]GET44141.1 hypothetical protein MiSe_89670 [Microseira wollei NIES-4236]
MKAPFLTGLTTATALTVILATSGIANAGTLIRTASYIPTGDETDVPPSYAINNYGRTAITDSPLSIEKFNPILGILKSVKIGFTGQIAGDGQLINRDAGAPKTITGAFSGNVTLKLPDSTPLFDKNPGQALIFPNVPRNQPVIFEGLTAGDSGENTYTDSAFLAQFIGVGNLNFLFSAQGTSQFTGPSNLTTIIDTYAKSSVTVTYEYDTPDQPPTKVPEPAVTLGLGLVAGLGLLSQKKKILKKI